jgi:arabinogalactan endo-1,4-beta-galactosidase
MKTISKKQFFQPGLPSSFYKNKNLAELRLITNIAKISNLFTTFCLVTLIGTSCKTQPGDIPTITPTLEMRGADVSLLPTLRATGTVFYNASGTAEDLLTTLKTNGVNTLRLRLWHSPNHINSDLATVTRLAAEAKTRGFKILLTVHYSDTWADPGAQTKPIAWQSLSFNLLKEVMY